MLTDPYLLEAYRIVGICSTRKRARRTPREALRLAKQVPILTREIELGRWCAFVSSSPNLMVEGLGKHEAQLKLFDIVADCLRYVEIEHVLTNPRDLLVPNRHSSGA